MSCSASMLIRRDVKCEVSDSTVNSLAVLANMLRYAWRIEKRLSGAREFRPRKPEIVAFDRQGQMSSRNIGSVSSWRYVHSFMGKRRPSGHSSTSLALNGQLHRDLITRLSSCTSPGPEKIYSGGRFFGLFRCLSSSFFFSLLWPDLRASRWLYWLLLEWTENNSRCWQITMNFVRCLGVKKFRHGWHLSHVLFSIKTRSFFAMNSLPALSSYTNWVKRNWQK